MASTATADTPTATTPASPSSSPKPSSSPAAAAPTTPTTTTEQQHAPAPRSADNIAPDTPSQTRRQKAEDEEAEKRLHQLQQSVAQSSTGRTSAGGGDEDADRCLICMNGFSKRQPPFKIPCSAKCNDTFVHERCVYEWKERQTGPGSCPLCRSPLLEMTYVPPDVLKSSTFHLIPVRRDFVRRPLDPQIGMVRLYVKVSKTLLTGAPCKFEVFLQAPSVLKYPLGPLPRQPHPAPGDQLLLVARKRFGFLRNRSMIELSLDRLGVDFERESDNFLGHVQCGLSGLEHFGYGAGDLTDELVCVQYNQNRIGRGVGPRKMRVCFCRPEADEAQAARRRRGLEEEDNNDDQAAAATNNEEELEYLQSASPFVAGVRHVRTPKDSLANVLRDNALREDDEEAEARDTPSSPTSASASSSSCIIGKNKEPYWLESIMAYSLDFHGRVTLPSNKNFILMIPNTNNRPTDAPAIPGDTATHNVCLQFGKVDETPLDCYTMDVAYPMSVLQAAMICLSACDRKLACA